MWKKLVRDERGSSIILAGLSLAVLLGVAGLVLDGGMLYVTKTEMKKAANAAVLSGAQELTNRDAAVRGVVQEVLKSHAETQSLVDTSIQMGDRVKVSLKREVKLGFAGVFGMPQAPVEAAAAAEIQPMGNAVGAVPVGIDDSIPLVYGQEYQLKDGPGEGTTGFYGILDFTAKGGGASEYEEALTNGYDGEVKVGDIVETKEGVVTGPTQRAVQSRIDRCPNPGDDMTVRDCARIMLVPIYRPYGHKQAQITGFAYFYLSQPTGKDKTIHGKFIKRAGTGFAKPGAVDKGAYAIRLIE